MVNFIFIFRDKLWKNSPISPNYGDGFRMFITRLKINSPCLYIYDLLNSYSPFTTLTYQELCALHGKNILSIRLLNKATTPLVHAILINFNILGRNFYRQFRKVQITENIKEETFVMIVKKIDIISQMW